MPTLTTPRPEPEYRCKQEELYQVCFLGWDSYLENVTDFTDRNTTYTLAFGQASRTDVQTAKEMPDFQARDAVPESFLVLMKEAATQCLVEWNFLETHIKKSFAENLHKPKLEAAGSEHYDKALHNNWASVSALMESGKKFISQNTATLTTGGMPAGFSASFGTIRTGFETLHTQFKDAEQDSEELRDDKIRANNAIFHLLSSMFEDGQKIYRDNAAKRERFMFSKVLELVSGGGGTPPVTGSFAVVTNQMVLSPITLEFISRNAGGGEELGGDWGDGYDLTATMPSGTYTSLPHSYIVVGVYTITISDKPSAPGGVAAMGEIRILNGQVISITIPDNAWLRNITLSGNPIVNFSVPATQTGLMHLDLSGCALVVDSTNGVLITVNGYGTSNGFIDISGGTNAAPTGAGLAAKAALIARGWTVVTN